MLKREKFGMSKILEEKSLGGRVFVSWENRREWGVWGSEKSLEHGLVMW